MFLEVHKECICLPKDEMDPPKNVGLIIPEYPAPEHFSYFGV